MEFDRQFRPTNRKTEMLMRPTSIMRYFHLATVALALWKLHVQDLLGSKLTTSSVYTLLPRPCEDPLSPPSHSLSLSFFPPILPSHSNHLYHVSSSTFFSHYILLFLPFVFFTSFSLCFVQSFSFSFSFNP